MSNFQYILVTVFIATAIIALLMFAGVIPGMKGGSGASTGVKITMWAPFDGNRMGSLINSLNNANKDLFELSYSQKNPVSYEGELVNALASANGPDIWVVSQDTILANKNKIFPIPFLSFSERSYKDTFVEATELFLDRKNGAVLAVPFAVDPLVLYWNRDLFSSSGVALPPKYWDEFLTNSQFLTKKDDVGNIAQAGSALGKYNNVKNAKEILSMLILQAGNPIVDTDSLSAKIGERAEGAKVDPTENAVSFFNDFANPKKAVYSWNSSLIPSDEMFGQGNLAMYFGYASEYSDIKEKNPHLNFDVTAVPQIRPAVGSTGRNVTFGRVYSTVVSKSSRNAQSAVSAIFKMAEQDFSTAFGEAFDMAPSRRDALMAGNKNPIFAIFYKSAIMAKSWLEPNATAVNKIFKNMVEIPASGKSGIYQAVWEAKGQINQLLK